MLYQSSILFHNLYAPWFALGITVVKGVNLDPELSL